MNNAPSSSTAEIGVVLALHAHLIPADADAADEGERCRCQTEQGRRRHLLPSSFCLFLTSFYFRAKLWKSMAHPGKE